MICALNNQLNYPEVGGVTVWSIDTALDDHIFGGYKRLGVSVVRQWMEPRQATYYSPHCL